MAKSGNKSLAEAQQMRDTIIAALEDAKGHGIKILDVQKLTDITDFMVVVTGTSQRHIKTMVDRVLQYMSDQGWKPLGVEGETQGDWVLADFVHVVVHVMREQTRSHYDLESLWDETFNETENADRVQPVSY